jgi:hypothetical protein
MKIELPREVKHAGQFRLVVFGGRKFQDENLLYEALDNVLMQCEMRDLRLLVVQGGSTGADAIAKDWAGYQDGAVDCATEEAFWDDLSHPDALIRTRRDGTKYDANAGPRRNQLMIDKYKPDYFISVSGGSGTADMGRRCHAARIPGVIYRGIDITTWPQMPLNS